MAAVRGNRSLLAVVLIVALQGTSFATTCGVPPPCARIRADSVLFTGTVLAADMAANDRDETPRIARVKVEEMFEGLPKGTAEVNVTSTGWLVRGKNYLFDLGRGEDGSLWPVPCGATGEVDADYVVDFLKFLRERKAGKAATSINVSVTDRYRAVAGVKVRIVAGSIERVATTDAQGNALFSPATPGRYHVDVSREFYDLDPESTESQTVDVLSGTCSGTRIGVTAQGFVSGIVKDARNLPMARLPLDLNLVDAGRSASGYYSSETDESGAFRFKQVSPGRYYVGTNLLDYLRSAPVPRVYYPGTRSQAEAVPIEVRAGAKVENLILTMPDFGARRTIRLAIVDEAGRPAADAIITNDTKADPDLSALHGPKTDDRGIAIIEGFEGAHYRVSAMVRGVDLRHTLTTKSPLDIPPGRGSFEGVLVVRPVFSNDVRK